MNQGGAGAGLPPGGPPAPPPLGQPPLLAVVPPQAPGGQGGAQGGAPAPGGVPAGAAAPPAPPANAADALALSLGAVLNHFNRQLNDQQVERASRKPPTFESGDPIEWMTFRRTFEITIQINHWPNNRARRELAGAMTGKAARAVAGIAIETPLGYPDIDYGVIIDAYQAIFLPPAASDLAVAQFEKCRQWADEEHLVWHSRCRDMFTRAYPGEPTEHNRRLVAAFCQGLANLQVKDYVFMHRPQAYTDALAAAQNREASIKCMVDMGPAPSTAEGSSQGGSIAAMGTGDTVGAMRKSGGVKCWHCEHMGHVQSKCPALIKAAKALGVDVTDALVKAAGGRRFNSNSKKPAFKKKFFKKKLNAIGEDEDEANYAASENQ